MEFSMRQSLSIGRIFGIDVRIHATWLLAFAFVTWGLANGYFRFIAPRQGLVLPLELGTISALLLFASVLVHELSHSLVAQALGMRVRNITLFIFGGVSNIGGEAPSARAEFLIAAVGPLTSFVLAGLFWVVGRSLGTSPGLDLLTGSIRALRAMTPVGAVLNYLVAVNILLGAFNLVPAFPLDGGRVFRSIVWGVTHRFGRATAIATTVGQAFGLLMIGLGVTRVAFGDLFGGVWSIFLGWFLVQAAGASRADHSLHEVLRGVPIGSVMDAAVPLVDRASSVQQLVYDYLLRSDRRRVIAVQDGVAVGVIEAGAANSVPREAWSSTPVGTIATPILFVVHPDDDAAAILTRLGDRTDLVPVVAEGRVVGAVDVWRLMRYAQLRRDLHVQVGSVRPSTA
jgi:Zn-dependent protease/predicted transcriptional regulator